MFKKLWNADFSKTKFPNLMWLWIIVSVYMVYDTYTGIYIPETFEVLYNQYFDKNPHLLIFKNSLYVLGGIAVSFLVGFVYFNETKAAKTIGEQKLRSISFSHFLVNILDVVMGILFLGFVTKILFLLSGYNLNISNLMDLKSKSHPFSFLIDFYNHSIPNIISLPLPIAFLLTIILADLPIYVMHYCTHWFRFLWYTSHRYHHTPVYLHPFGSGPVFGLNFLYSVPFFLFKLLISKLVFVDTSAMIVSLLVFQFFLFVLEKFNHSNPFYHVAFKNKFLYTLFHFFGCGPYHMAHHSAKEGEEIVNLANLGFCFWDRVFGTFKEPEKEILPIGLTNQPTIVLNPLRLYLSGMATILYELKHNSVKHWFKILFGSVYYSPPITKDFLIVSYPEKMVATP